MATRSALLVGGTGPTGPHIAQGLERQGYVVTVLHTGAHEIDEVAHLEHLHADVRSGAAVGQTIGGRTFDLAVVTYGRLREIAEALVGRVGQFVSVGGAPAYAGFFDADHWDPPGLPVPTAEDAPTADQGHTTQNRAGGFDTKSERIRQTELRVFGHHPDATHVRYPYVYGPRQPVPLAWYFVRRLLDGRRRVVVPDGGLTLTSAGFVENLAHGVVLAADNERARGEIFNLADSETLALAQIGRICAQTLGIDVDLVSIPYQWATCSRPVVGQRRATHRVLDTAKSVRLLGYDDVVPAREAHRRTARWLADNRPDPGGIEEHILEDPFDYEAEDRLLDWWDDATQRWPEPYPAPATTPGYGLHYGGPRATNDRGHRPEG